MLTHTTLPENTDELFYGFAGLTFDQKLWLVRNKAMLVDAYEQDEFLVNVYLLYGFFVEETVRQKDATVTELVPYKRGFSLRQHFEQHLRSMNFLAAKPVRRFISDAEQR